jgi:hypothetical protein
LQLTFDQHFRSPALPVVAEGASSSTLVLGGRWATATNLQPLPRPVPVSPSRGALGQGLAVSLDLERPRSGPRFLIDDPLTKMYESLLSQLLAGNQVPAARRVLASVPASASSELVRTLRDVLKPPSHRGSRPARSGGEKSLRWLADNAPAFKDRWVAVSEGVLVDSDSSLKALLSRLKGHDPQPLLHRL